MRKIIGVCLFILSVGIGISEYRDVNAASGINNGMSGVFSIGLSSTPTPAPTASPAPTAFNTPTPIPTATPLTLPLSLANGGFGIDMSSPAPLFRQSKNMGTAGTNGGFTATSVVRVTLAADQSAAGIFWYFLVSRDTSSRYVVQAGHIPFVCAEESGGTMAGGIPSTSAGVQNEAGAVTTIASFSGGITLSKTTGTNTCDIQVANAITVGTATSNTLYWNIWPMGTNGTWSAQ